MLVWPSSCWVKNRIKMHSFYRKNSKVHVVRADTWRRDKWNWKNNLSDVEKFSKLAKTTTQLQLLGASWKYVQNSKRRNSLKKRLNFKQKYQIQAKRRDKNKTVQIKLVDSLVKFLSRWWRTFTICKESVRVTFFWINIARASGTVLWSTLPFLCMLYPPKASKM